MGKDPKETLAKWLGIPSSLVIFFYGFAMIPLPTFPDSPTGLRLSWNVMLKDYANKHHDKVLALSEIQQKQLEQQEKIQSEQWFFNMHLNNPPRRLDYSTESEYLQRMEWWHNEKKERENKIKELQHEDLNFEFQRIRVANSRVI
jgi:hypothetical protein